MSDDNRLSNGDTDMHKQLFDDAIGEVPPSTVDVAAVIARGRRVELVRRAASPVVATTAAVAVLMGGVAVVLLTGDPQDGGLGPVASPSTTTSPPAPLDPRPCDGIAPTAPPAPEKPSVTASRLTAATTDAVSSRLGQGATLKPNPDMKDGLGNKIGPFGPLEFYHELRPSKEIPDGCQTGDDYFRGEAFVRFADGTGGIDVLVGRAGGANGGDGPRRCGDPMAMVDGETFCHNAKTAGGDEVQQSTRSFGDVVINEDFVYRADDTFVQIESSNVAPADNAEGPPTASKVPFTHAQLTAIALDPRLTMYPH